MYIKNGRRFNLAGYLGGVWIDDSGVQHSGRLLLDPEFRQQHGIEEIPDPPRGDDDTQYTQEIDASPYIVITDKPIEQIQEIMTIKLTRTIQSKLDQEAQNKGYDNIVSACSYAAIASPFQAESVSFINWRSACWQYVYQVLSDVQQNKRTIPTPEQLLSELPTRVIPT